jgi:hypothetical protein
MINMNEREEIIKRISEVISGDFNRINELFSEENSSVIKKEFVKISEEEIVNLKDNIKKQYKINEDKRDDGLRSGIISESVSGYRDPTEYFEEESAKLLKLIRTAKKEEGYSIMNILHKKINPDLHSENSVQTEIYKLIDSENKNTNSIIYHLNNNKKEFNYAIKNISKEEFEKLQEVCCTLTDDVIVSEKLNKMLNYSSYVREENLLTTVQDFIAFNGSPENSSMSYKEHVGEKIRSRKMS